jgi:hypothetical protein
VFANFKKEFAETPVKTLGSALAIAGTVGTLAWAAMALIPSALVQDVPAWTPVYFLGAALGVGFALISLAAFRLGSVVGWGVSAVLLYCLADAVAWLLTIVSPIVGSSDLWLTGVVAFVAFWAVTIQNLVEIARSGRHSDFGLLVFLTVLFVMPASALGFAAVVSLNLPVEMQFFAISLK